MLKSQDLWAGLLFMAVGAFAVAMGSTYDIGRAAQMGPGYVPSLIGWCLVGLGAVIAGKGVIAGSPEIIPGALKPVVLIIGGTLLFGLLIDRAGLVVAVIATTLLTAFAARERPNLLHLPLLAVALSAGAVLLFVWGLKQAIPVWWGE